MVQNIQTDTTVQNEQTFSTAESNALVKSIKTTSGIDLSFMQSDLSAPVNLKHEPPFAPLGIGIGFCLSGQSEIESESDGNRYRYVFKPGESVLNWCNCLSGLYHTIGPGRTVLLTLTMSHERLSEVAEQHKHRLPSFLRRPPDILAQQKDIVSLSMREAILQIMRCPYQGLTRDFFIESKALELLAYKLDQVDSQVDPSKASPPKKSDVERMQFAAELLTKKPENAPGLEQLARSVGMCRTKFHECFRSVHGVTPFDYFQSYRLEAARLNLLEGKMNVTETALAIGYSNPSFFSKAFKKHFGIPPGQYRKKRMIQY